jgi:Ca2+-binding EF-hand superfamily protein
VDRERTGNITPEAINAFLADVGLEPTPFDMRHIMTELDTAHTGVVSRTSFISFIRHGGQPPTQNQVKNVLFFLRSHRTFVIVRVETPAVSS